MVRSQHMRCLLYAIYKGHGGGVVSVICAILGCAAQVCLLAAVLCGSPATVCPYPMFTAGGLCCVCSLSFVSAHPRIAHITDTPPPVPLTNSI